MKAVIVRKFGEPDVMRLEPLPDIKPGPAQIVVSLKAAGINPVETYIRAGTYQNKPELPYTPGTDGAGIVKTVGADITSFSPGDRVYLSGSLSGTYAEEAICTAEQLHPLPESVPFEAGACINIPYSAAYRALFQRAKAERNEYVLIHGGTGSVGLAAIQWAASRGLRIIATGGSPEGLEKAKALGAQWVLNHHEADYLSALYEITGGQGVNIILEMLADINLNNDLKHLAEKGRVVIIGSRGNIEITPRAMMEKETAVLGMMLKSASEDEKLEIHQAISDGLKTGKLNPAAGKTFRLEEAPLAHVEVMKPGAGGNIVLLV